MRGDVAVLWLLAAWGCSSAASPCKGVALDADGGAQRASSPLAEAGTTLACGCEADACFRKCCPRGETKNANRSADSNKPCVPLDVKYEFAPRVHRLPDLTPVLLDRSQMVVLYGDPCDNGMYVLDPEQYTYDEFYLLADGRIYIPDQNATYDVSQFCVEAGPQGEVQAYFCFSKSAPEEATESKALVPMAYPVGMIISLPFLLATLVVYAAVPQLRNLHGRALMSYVVSLICTYACLTVVQLFNDSMDMNLCISLAFIIYFSFLASFFWLNVMCFDIWWTFTGFRPLRGSEKERERKKFIIYSIYAWGSSMLLLLMCLLMDRLPGIPEHVVAPQIGTDRCWFQTREAEAAYFYGPMALLVICNVVLFVLTALRIVQLKKETAMLKGEESRRHDMEENKQRFVLYLKLFVVMGVNWGMEVISFAVDGPKYLWYVTDIGNTLQGVLIFLIFVWKEKIRRLLVKRLCPRMTRNATRSDSHLRRTLSKSVATPTSSFSLSTKATTNGFSETTRMTREESDVV